MWSKRQTLFVAVVLHCCDIAAHHCFVNNERWCINLIGTNQDTDPLLLAKSYDLGFYNHW